VAARQRLDDARDRDATLAWTIVQLSRAKTVPALEKLLTRRQVAAPTPEGQRAALATLAEQYGIPLRKGIKGRVIRYG
jgi:hypothetical protein